MAELISESGLFTGQHFQLHDRTRIGRAPENEIVLSDHLTSRYHAELNRRGADYYFRDLGSKNGVWVNDQQVTEKRVETGDRLKIGQTVFLFESREEVRASRFTDTAVHFNPSLHESIQSFKANQLPEPSEQVPSSWLTELSQVFQTQASEIPERLQALLHGLMDWAGAEGGALLVRASSGSPTPLIALAKDQRLLLGTFSLHTVMDQAEAVLSQVTLKDAEATDSGVHLKQDRSAALVPMMQDRRVLGVVYLERDGQQAFTKDDLATIAYWSRGAAQALLHLRRIDQRNGTSQVQRALSYIGASTASEKIRQQIERLALTDTTVMICGETGTGKELVAKLLHESSDRASGPFVAINCAAIPENLIESELFGHEAGAFTGAQKMRQGRIEAADGGTLFLDEIGEMHPDLQPKLLRFLEERVFTRVGGIREISADVRILAATNRDLQAAVEAELFRQDLLYRLNVMQIELPPLRKRPEDIRVLVEYFTPELASHVGQPFLGWVDEIWPLLRRYSWPGNTRELRHSIERALILSDDGVLRPEHFQLDISKAGQENNTDAHPSTGGHSTQQTQKARAGGDKPRTLADVEREAIERALRFTNGNKIKAAELLQIHRNTLTKKVQDYGLDW